jgi:hypothetical protein
MAMERLPCPECRRKFDTSVAFHFHIKNEHGTGTLETSRPMIRQAAAREYREKKRLVEERAWKVCEALFQLGCPCGKSLTWHREQHRAAGGLA